MNGVRYLGRCKCGTGYRLDLPAVETIREYLDGAIEEANRLQDAGTIVGLTERMAWLEERRVEVQVPTSRLASRWTTCGCGKHVALRLVVGRVTGHDCGAKCRNAVGPSCDCACGGENHGAGWGPAVSDQ